MPGPLNEETLNTLIATILSQDTPANRILKDAAKADWRQFIKNNFAVTQQQQDGMDNQHPNIVQSMQNSVNTAIDTGGELYIDLLRPRRITGMRATGEVVVKASADSDGKARVEVGYRCSW